MIEITHFGADSATLTASRRDSVIAIEHAQIRCAMVLQQDMSGHLIRIAVATEVGTTAFMQGADEADEPTQRTLTSAIARVGTTA